MRLFRAWSMVDNFLGQERVRIDWFVIGRTAPPAPYEELIRDYDQEDENACYDEILANELFLETEIEELKKYLFGKHQIDLYSEAVEVPIKPGTLSYGLLLISGEKGFYGLVEEADYDLNFSVLGHYDAQEVKTPRLMDQEDLALGSNFLDRVFEQLNIEGIERDAIHNLLKKIYTEYGLKVVMAKPLI